MGKRSAIGEQGNKLIQACMDLVRDSMAGKALGFLTDKHRKSLVRLLGCKGPANDELGTSEEIDAAATPLVCAFGCTGKRGVHF